MESFVQFLNVGFGIINNTEAVDSWDVDGSMEEALFLDNPNLDIRIIGFRFYDIDPATNTVVKQSGIYYLGGEPLTYPKVDPEVETVIRNSGRVYEKGQRLVKIEKPNIMIYPYNPNDQILDTAKALAKIKIQKETERLSQLKQGMEDYRLSLVDEIKKIMEAIETNSFHNIPMVDTEIDDSEGCKSLNILNDGGNFNKHIEHLRNQRLEIMNIERFLKENQGR